MRTILVVLLWLLFSGGVEVYAQAATPTPQSARQALIEMFVGKGANDFAKHLPEATRQNSDSQRQDSGDIVRITYLSSRPPNGGLRRAFRNL